MDEILREHSFYVQSESGKPDGLTLQSRVSELETEVAKLRDELATAKGLNDDMWENIVQKILAGGGDVVKANGPEAESETNERSRKRSRNVR